MRRFVIDASVAASWYFDDESTQYTLSVLEAAKIQPHSACAPRLWAYEVRNSILKGLRRKRITRTRLDEFRRSIGLLPISLMDPGSYDTLLNLAIQHNLSVYDAAYLDLALREHLPLATLDKALLRAAEAAGVASFQP